MYIKYRTLIAKLLMVFLLLFFLLFSSPLSPLFHRFLIDVKWLKQWKKYVGYDQWDQYHVGKVSANPGPIDNANLFKGTQ